MSWNDLEGKDLISIKDWTKEELDILLRVAGDLKSRYYSGEELDILENDTFMMLFFNSSTRTRQSFEAGMSQLGGHSQFLAPETMRISLDREPGGGESIKDTTKVMGRYSEGIGVRLLEDKVDYYGQGTEILYEMGKYSTVPIINMAHYSMVKTTFFNGIQHPAIAIKRCENIEVIREFNYHDYKNKLG